MGKFISDIIVSDTDGKSLYLVHHSSVRLILDMGAFRRLLLDDMGWVEVRQTVSDIVLQAGKAGKGLLERSVQW